MKKRGINSPDMADALALTFAAPVIATSYPSTSNFMSPPAYGPLGKILGGTEVDWDPYGGN